MTLGTNASLAEQIEYAPSEINFALIVEAIEELAEWRQLLGPYDGGPEDIGTQIECDKDTINRLEKDLDRVRDKLEAAEDEIASLKAELSEKESGGDL